MRIHITTIAPEKAAREIMAHMKANGGEWIVNAVEDEGYIMARVGTLDGKRLSRSLSPCLCGPFNAKWRLAVIEGDIGLARTISLGVKSSIAAVVPPTEGRSEGWISPTRAALEMLGRGTVTVAYLRDALGIPRNDAHCVLRRLVSSNRARVVDRIKAANGSSVCIYGAAA